MKHFNEYRKIKSERGFINEQEFMVDKGPEQLEIEVVDSNEQPVMSPTKIPLTQVSAPAMETGEIEGSPTPDSLMTCLVNFHLQLRIIHWNTTDYPQHMASGGTYEALDGVLDTLVETYQGYNERVKFCDCIHIKNLDELIIDEWIGKTEETISTLRSLVPQTDLQNILDEAAGLIGKLKYLFTLK